MISDQTESWTFKERFEKSKQTRRNRIRRRQRLFVIALGIVAACINLYLWLCNTTPAPVPTPPKKPTPPPPPVVAQVDPLAYLPGKRWPPPEYKKEGQIIMEVEATAYWTHDPVDASGHGIAYDGTPAVAYQTIAVDPKVIPLQSQVFVPGIGWCRANDTGNAIKGKIIDIAMPSREAAWKWGRRKIWVTVRKPPVTK